MNSYLKCHNVAKYIKFYLAELQFTVTSTGNAGCFKRAYENLLDSKEYKLSIV
jgi:hypothetical protein